MEVQSLTHDEWKADFTKRLARLDASLADSRGKLDAWEAAVRLPPGPEREVAIVRATDAMMEDMPQGETRTMRENHVRAARMQRGMTQTRLSALTGIAQSDLSAIENGRRHPGDGWRRRIAAALEVPAGELFEDEAQHGRGAGDAGALPGGITMSEQSHKETADMNFTKRPRLDVTGAPRAMLWFQAHNLLRIAGQDLRACPCGRLFVREGKRQYCSDRCQKRYYMRDRRARERAEQEDADGKTTRTEGLARLDASLADSRGKLDAWEAAVRLPPGPEREVAIVRATDAMMEDMPPLPGDVSEALRAYLAGDDERVADIAAALFVAHLDSKPGPTLDAVIAAIDELWGLPGGQTTDELRAWLRPLWPPARVVQL